MKKKIYFLSASDRFNYGDLLLPLVAKHELSKFENFDFHNISTTKSNLKKCGALKTYSYNHLKRVKSKATLIILGGEVLGASCSKLMSFINPLYYYFFHKTYLNLFLNIIIKLHGLEDFPFIPTDKNIISKFNIIYHAVGGISPNNEKIKRTLENSQYLSVRDKRSQRDLKRKFNISANLIPDSVVLLSDIWEKRNYQLLQTDKYICAQFGYYKSKKYLREILKQLKILYLKSKLTIGLLSIGNCPGHSDIKSIKWFKKNADFPLKILPHDNLKNITQSIINSEIFVGTSLHGNIVSMSYGVPFVAVGKNLCKLKSYTKTWAPKNFQDCINFEEISKIVLARLNKTPENYAEIILKQKQIVRKSFKNIYNMI